MQVGCCCGVTVKVRVWDRCVQGLKCLRTEVTIHQFGPIYRGGLCGPRDDFFSRGSGDPPTGRGNFSGGIGQRNITQRRMWHTGS